MDKKFIKTAAVWAAVIALLFIAVINPEALFRITGKIIKPLTPLLIGMGFAFVLNRPIFALNAFFRKALKNAGDNAVNALSVTVAYAVFTGIIAGALLIIVPQLIDNIKYLFENIDAYYENFMSFYRRMENRDRLGIFRFISEYMGELKANVPEIAGKTYEKTSGLVRGFVNIIIGFVVSIYIQLDKKRIKRAAASLTKAVTRPETFKTIKKYYRLVFTTFSNFVSGQMTEAFLLGGLCFIGMVVFRFEYALLISAIIGLTALIPVAGAIIGTVPAAFLLMLINPMKAVWFIVFIIILQQFENNLIYPKVVGKTLGIPPILVLTAIILGAGIGGITGIVLGVPLMAVIYAILHELTARSEE